MAIGEGKYDVLCTFVRETAMAEAAIVIVLGGMLGNGFSVQMRVDEGAEALAPEKLLALCRVLEDLVAQLRTDAAAQAPASDTVQ